MATDKIPTFEVYGKPSDSPNAQPFLIGEIKARSNAQGKRAALLLAKWKGMTLVAVKPI